MNFEQQPTPSIEQVASWIETARELDNIRENKLSYLDKSFSLDNGSTLYYACANGMALVGKYITEHPEMTPNEVLEQVHAEFKNLAFQHEDKWPVLTYDDKFYSPYKTHRALAFLTGIPTKDIRRIDNWHLEKHAYEIVELVRKGEILGEEVVSV